MRKMPTTTNDTDLHRSIVPDWRASSSIRLTVAATLSEGPWFATGSADNGGLPTPNHPTQNGPVSAQAKVSGKQTPCFLAQPLAVRRPTLALPNDRRHRRDEFGLIFLWPE